MSTYFQTVVVLTDQYPPDVLGGAELSLHTIIAGMNYHNKRVVVVSLANRSARETYQGIEVIRVPFRYPWPRFVHQPTRRERIETLLREGARAARQRNRNFMALARVSLRAHKRHRRVLRAFPHVDQQALQYNEVLDELRRVMMELQPDLIHADNYKSILLAHALGIDVPVVGLVRDNRFFCAHRDQATTVQGRVCEPCDFSCVDGLAAPAFLDEVKQVMAETLDYRVKALQRSAVVVATSRYLADGLRRAGMKRVEIIRNPVDSANSIAAAQRGIDRARPPEILCVGMVSHNKGQHLLVAALPELLRQIGDFKLVIAGRGSLATKLEREAADLGLRDHLVVTGFLDRQSLFRTYARSTIVVCPNAWPEPFGRVPLEAALSRRPVVAFDTGAMREQVVDGVTGFVVDAQDIDSLIDKTSQLVRCPETAARMGLAGYERMLTEQREADPSAALLRVWESAMNDPR